MKLIKPVIRKEFFHILRDPRSLTIVFVMPVFMIFIYGYSISFDLNRIDVAVVDGSHSPLSQELLDRFASTPTFAFRQIPGPGDAMAGAEAMLRAGLVQEILVIPPDFATLAASGRTAPLGLVIDGSDSNVANLVYQYSERVVQQFLLDKAGFEDLIKIRTQMFFNPEARSSYFFVPGLVAILLLMVSALLTSISIARERETGSLDLLFISPLRSSEIILGKTLPYMLVSFIGGLTILLFARFWFGIPFRGSLTVLLLFSLLYLLCGLSFGILISTIAPDQRIAMIATLLITMLPSIMLSGFIFPLDSLPLALRLIAHVIPATYFLRIIRGVVLKGAPLSAFWFEGTMMLLFSIVITVVAVAHFTRQRRNAR